MATELASIVQSAHIQHDPDPDRDIAPSTAADKRIPADIVSSDELHDFLDDQDDNASTHSSSPSDTSTIPSDIIVPRPRRPIAGQRQHLPLPDLRFEQTYLASIRNADTTAKVVYITIRDQVLLPLAQGVGYHLIIFGWRHWNRGSQFVGTSLGAKLRRWWWEVNGWKRPAGSTMGTNVGAREGFARDAKDFYVGTFGSGLGD